jgi:hypothetical protein
MPRTYVTDLDDFLNAEGEIPKSIPKEARVLASFLVLVVDAVTSAFPHDSIGVETGIRCRRKNCRGNIMAAVDSPAGPVHWQCPVCGDGGTVSNWQATKWDKMRK